VDEPALVSIETERSVAPPAVVVRVAGELDFGTTPQLVSAVDGEPAAGTDMILDLTGVEFCDSSALGAMIAMHKAALAAGARLYLTGVPAQVLAAITVTSLDQLFDIRDDVEAAYAEIEAR
jgi:anti-sigma B factor antagonist